jgi:hypothetical protein
MHIADDRDESLHCPAQALMILIGRLKLREEGIAVLAQALDLGRQLFRRAPAADAITRQHHDLLTVVPMRFRSPAKPV